MKILAVALLLAVSACTTTEAGAPAREAWLTGKLTFREVRSEAPTSKPSSGYPAPQHKADAPEVRTAQATRQSTDDDTREQALAAFDCGAPDPLVGNDDAARPLITCVGQQVAILINGRVLSAPSIQSPILGGVTEISGQFTKDEAEQLAQQLSGR